MNLSLSRLTLAVATVFLTHTAVAAQPLATVNGKPIPASHAASLLEEQKAQGVPDSDELKQAIREELIRREAITQAALAKGLEKQDRVRTQMEMASQAVLLRSYIQDFIESNPITDAEVLAEYENVKAEMGGNEYKARHILVENENQARALIAKLNAGESFEELAKESLDPGSKERGGDLGWANPGMFVPPFSAAMTQLEKGKHTTEPVKSDFGWHVIRLDDTRPVEFPAIDEVKPQLQQRLQQQKIEIHVEELRAKATVK